MDDLFVKMRAHLADCGVPTETTDDMRGASMGVRPFVSFAQPDVLLEDGDRPDIAGWDLRAVWTPGHSPGHLCFYAPERKLLLSGDHVLPRITPNISFHPQAGDDPLGNFLRSLRKLEPYDSDEVLPAHEHRFVGLQARLTELIDHHESRFAEVVEAVKAGRDTAWAVAGCMKWSRSWDRIEGFMRRAAVAEAMAHIRALERRGVLRELPGEPVRYEVIAAS
jgi:glyoxylase-like metal-dependent hydrolase (beta-lactamase superfamily II)